MKTDLKELRRTNLKKKAEEAGGSAALARALGYANQSFLSNVLTGLKPLGERAARSIERKAGWPEYELDRLPGEPLPFHGTDRQMIAACVRAIGDALGERQITPAKFAELVALYYEHCTTRGSLDPAHLARLLKLL